MLRAQCMVWLCVAVIAIGAVASAEQLEELGKEGIYRPQPNLARAELVLVPPADLKPGLAYNYYNERLGRRVWGFATKDGRFRYAFGEGSTLPTDRFDLQLSEAAQRRILEQGVPGLEENLAITGSRPAVRLDSNGKWHVLAFRSIARIYDLETGHRWEWHGSHRKAVLHTFGDQWLIVDGRYVPATGPVFLAGGCPILVRAGSIVFVMRTPE